MNSKYTGCWTALVTPFNGNMRVNWEQLEKNVGFQVEQKVSGILPMGSTGESATVTHEEHSQIIEKVNEYAGKKTKVLAGTGSNSTEEAIYETQKAVEAGVDACLLVDCYYNKPSSMELRKEYYEVILKKFPKMDFIAYAIPGRSVTVLMPEDMALLRSECKNFVGVKEATGDFERMQRTRQLLGKDFSIISGDDPNTFRMMTDPKIGSSGVISVISNITPGAIEEYTQMILKGKVEEARKIDSALQPLFNVVGVKTTEKVKLPSGETAEVVQKVPNPVPVKTMMNALGMQTGLCKQPLGRLSKQGIETVRNALRQVWKNYPKALEPIEGYYDVNIEEKLGDDKNWKNLSY
ncbi:MAG: 4-hydroxy-tetrahydrodipicolinate synthase [Candidatus Altiarchaeales archaeon]|nr:4-hydroxy-tetrahydrodipicolinate synthase [Candidatus Altiarchaeales archaeon]